MEGGRVSSYFGHPWMRGLVPGHNLLKIGGVRLIASKIDFYFLRAHLIFGARQFFETTFGHIQNFWQKKIFENVPHLL